MHPTSTEVAELLTGSAAASGDRPLLTYCDDATGERTELTASALGTWAARTAGLLRDGCGLETRDRAAVLLPPHWQTAAVLLGAWSAGVSVSYRSWAVAGLTPSTHEKDLDAVFVSRDRLDSWLESVPEATHRFVLGLASSESTTPDGYRDYLSEVQRYPGNLPAYAAIRYTDPASPDGTTYREWGNLAREMADAQGLRAGDRVLVDATHTAEPVMWLLAPLAAGASIVICANLDRARLEERATAEGATRVL
jgi:uncharacterized protein (TIGR03089 family)